MNTELMVIVTASVLIPVVVMIAILRVRRRDYVPGSRYFTRKPVALTFPEGKFEFRYRAVTRNKNGAEVRPASIEVSVPAVSNGLFFLVSPDDSDSFHLKWGTTAPSKLNVPELDRKFFVVAPDPEATRRFLADPRHREAIRDLEKLGFNEFLYDGKRLRVRWVRFRRALEDGSVPDLAAAAKSMAVLAGAVRVGFARCDAGKTWRYALVHRGLPTTIPLFTLSILVVGLLFVSAMGTAGYPPLRWLEVWKIAIPTLIATTIGMALLVRTFARGYHLRGQSVTYALMFGLVVTVTVSVFGTVYVNGTWGDQTPQYHTAKIESRYSRSRKGGRDYYFVIPSWRASEETLSISVYRDEYERLDGKTLLLLEMEVYDGALGIEWSRRHKIYKGSVTE